MDAQRSLISHLLRRAGFGATPAELDEYVQLGYQGTVDRLLNYDQTPDTYPAYTPTDLNPQGKPKLEELQTWWLNRMLTTTRPLQEKMTLFWHGHFATGAPKVNDTQWMATQNELLRHNALGPFPVMLSAVSKDPAMMKWLDLQTDTKASPNENYAREVMELFTIGIGNYTEEDVKEGARALTGWAFRKDSTIGTFVPNRHDSGIKTFLGQTGPFGLEDIVSILSSSPKTATFLAAKLARFFISDTPDAVSVGQIAAAFSGSNGDMRQVMRAVFNTAAFQDPVGFMNKVRTPVEYVVTYLRLLGVQSVDRTVLPALREMGQELFNPPNVAGWPGGRSWLNTDTIFARLNFADRLVSNRNASGSGYVDPATLLGTHLDPVAFFSTLLTDGAIPASTAPILQAYLSSAARDAAAKLRGLVHLILSTPTANLN